MFKIELKIYWRDEDQAFIAEVPELPGCAADGKELQGSCRECRRLSLKNGLKPQKNWGGPFPSRVH